jgi:predicted RNA-binding Zn ribbon-like protein
MNFNSQMSQTGSKSPFEYTGGSLALDFVNTVENRNNEQRLEMLTDYGRLLEWARGERFLPPQCLNRLERLAREDPAQAQSVLRRVIRLREALHATFTAVVEERTIPAECLDTLNTAAREAATHARLTQNDEKLAWEWIDPDRHLDSLLWPVARAAAQLLTSSELSFIRCCASDTCRWLFLDKTKNHRRRWCEMKTCGNRDKARRYYQRQKAG